MNFYLRIQCKTKQLFFKKKILTNLIKKVACWKKRTDDPRGESIIEDPEEVLITEISRKTLSLRNLKRTLSLRNLKRESYHWGPSGASAPPVSFLRRKKKLFLAFFDDWVGDGDKFSNKNFRFGRPRFYTTVT